MNIKAALLFWLLSQASAQDVNCDFYQNVQTATSYYVYSPNYPRNYSGGVQCRWIAACPSGYNCRLDCPQIDLPQTQSCNMDRLLISRSGDPQLAGAETYCGRGSLSIVSTGQRISIGLITSSSSPGGRFSCQLTAQPATPSSQCQCGERKQNRIVGGEETGVNEYRMMVGLADVGIRQIKCGAVLISDRHVLTAAHCVQNKSTNDFAVIVGEHNVNTGSDTSATKGYRIQSYTIYPRFTESNYDNDIAILTVEGQIEFNNSFAGSKDTALEMNIKAALLFWLLSQASAQDVNCDFYQNVQAATSYYVYSPNYPRNYSGGVQCRWIAACPSGYNCRLDCPQIDLPQNRIVGGEETGVNEYRMMVGLADVAIRQIKCGAVLISDRHVLTAAHCVQNKSTSDFAVIVGEHNVNTGSDTSATKGYRIQSYTIYPRFTESNYDNDIAIVTVEGQIEFNNGVGPACLPFKFRNNSFAGSKVTALGWGTLFPGGPDSNVLQKVTLDVISQSSCKSKVPSLTDRQMCTYTPGKDACQDDSGGPLLYTDPATGLLFSVGIVSYGRFCASSEPGINTRVTMFLDWIVANAPYNYCVK